MAVLFDIQDQNWMANAAIRDGIKNIPASKMRFYPDFHQSGDIEMLVCDRLRPGLAKQLPNLKLVQKMGAGVETMVNDPDLGAHVRITRVQSDVVGLEMARYCLSHVLSDIYFAADYRRKQRMKQWMPVAPLLPQDLNVAVLGLGRIGAAAADMFASMGFGVLGWSRTEKKRTGVQCHWGRRGLPEVLKNADYVIAVLPATERTLRLLDAETFASMKAGSMLINVGRGSLIDESDLLEALDAGRPSRAVLDVFQNEPLPEDHQFWRHPGVTITPHVSGWHLGDVLDTVSENYHRLLHDEQMLNEINRRRGY